VHPGTHEFPLDETITAVTLAGALAILERKPGDEAARKLRFFGPG